MFGAVPVTALTIKPDGNSKPLTAHPTNGVPIKGFNVSKPITESSETTKDVACIIVAVMPNLVIVDSLAIKGSDSIL